MASLSGLAGTGRPCIVATTPNEWSHFTHVHSTGDGIRELAVSARIADDTDNSPNGRVYLFDLPTLDLLRFFDPPAPESIFDGSFGSALTNLGPLEEAGPPVLAISASDMGNGDGRVFLFNATNSAFILEVFPPTPALA